MMVIVTLKRVTVSVLLASLVKGGFVVKHSILLYKKQTASSI